MDRPKGPPFTSAALAAPSGPWSLSAGWAGPSSHHQGGRQSHRTWSTAAAWKATQTPAAAPSMCLVPALWLGGGPCATWGIRNMCAFEKGRSLVGVSVLPGWCEEKEEKDNFYIFKSVSFSNIVNALVTSCSRVKKREICWHDGKTTPRGWKQNTKNVITWVVSHTRTHTHTCTHARTHAHTHARTHPRTHARTHARPHTHTHTHTDACWFSPMQIPTFWLVWRQRRGQCGWVHLSHITWASRGTKIGTCRPIQASKAIAAKDKSGSFHATCTSTQQPSLGLTSHHEHVTSFTSTQQPSLGLTSHHEHVTSFTK